MQTITLQGRTMSIARQTYGDGSTALEIIDTDGARWGVASVNLGPLPEGLIAIKDYSENEGVLEALVEAGIVSGPLERVKSGFVTIPVCFLRDEAHEWWAGFAGPFDTSAEALAYLVHCPEDSVAFPVDEAKEALACEEGRHHDIPKRIESRIVYECLRCGRWMTTQTYLTGVHVLDDAAVRALGVEGF